MEEPVTEEHEDSDWAKDEGLTRSDEPKNCLTLSRAFSYREPAGWWRVRGALIHIDIDVGEGKYFEIKSDAIDYVRQVMEAHPEWSGSLYTTYGGIRLIMTHRLAFPRDAKAEMDAFEHMDEAYRKGCMQENEFRIRVSPKPGREEACIAYWTCNYGTKVDPIANELRLWVDRMCDAF